MTEQDGVEEVVLLFDADMSGIEREMHASEFSAVVEGSVRLERFAASAVKAVFAVVEVALSVRSMVFFTFKMDEEGLLRVADAFQRRTDHHTLRPPELP